MSRQDSTPSNYLVCAVNQPAGGRQQIGWRRRVMASGLAEFPISVIVGTSENGY